MALIEIKVPDIGDFKDVAVIELLVKPGDALRAEQSLVTVESDKASMESPAPRSGVPFSDESRPRGDAYEYALGRMAGDPQVEVGVEAEAVNVDREHLLDAQVDDVRGFHPVRALRLDLDVVRRRPVQARRRLTRERGIGLAAEIPVVGVEGHLDLRDLVAREHLHLVAAVIGRWTVGVHDDGVWRLELP